MTHGRQNFYVDLPTERVMHPGDLCRLEHAYWWTGSQKDLLFKEELLLKARKKEVKITA